MSIGYLLPTSPLAKITVLLILFFSSPGRATQWTVRSYAVLTSLADGPYSYSSTVYLSSLSSTPTASPYSSTTSVYSYRDVTYITYYLPPGAVAQAVIASATADSSSGITLSYFYMPIEYTAPTTCPTQFTYTTSTSVYVPEGAETQVTPTSTKSRYIGDGDYVISAFLTASAVSIPTASQTSDFIYSYYIASCSNPSTTRSYGYSYPYPTATGGATYSGGSSYSSYRDQTCLGSLCPFWLIYVIIFCTVIPLLFVLGLFESYYWFSRFMKGRSAFRGVPLFWVCISLWTLLCLRRRSHVRPEYQQKLERQWRDMSTGTRLSLWMKYGFRHSNPPLMDTILNGNAQHSMVYQDPPPNYAAMGQQPYGPPPIQTAGMIYHSPHSGPFQYQNPPFQIPNVYPNQGTLQSQSSISPSSKPQSSFYGPSSSIKGPNPSVSEPYSQSNVPSPLPSPQDPSHNSIPSQPLPQITTVTGNSATTSTQPQPHRLDDSSVSNEHGPVEAVYHVANK